MIQKKWISCVFLCMALFFAGCAALEQADLWKKPGMKFKDARITALDVEGMTFHLDLDILNPNSYAIAYGAMEYQLNLQNTNFLSGKLEQSGRIEAGQTQKVALPVSFKFADMLDLAKKTTDGTFTYALDAAMLFNVPLAGEVKLPVRTKGSLPIPRPPGIGLSSLNVDNLSMTGADILLRFGMENPNAFDLRLDGFDYALGLNGKNILSGHSGKRQVLEAQKTGVAEIPVRLSFLEGGGALYRILAGGGSFQYQLDFNSVLGSSLPALQNLPFATQTTGTVHLTR